MTEPTQMPLFGRRLDDAASRAPAPKRKKYRGHAQTILERLQKGPATSRELVDIAFGYRQRISDLRKAGYNVKCDDSVEPSVYSL